VVSPVSNVDEVVATIRAVMNAFILLIDDRPIQPTQTAPTTCQFKPAPLASYPCDATRPQIGVKGWTNWKSWLENQRTSRSSARATDHAVITDELAGM
jgi:hypothetical protein